jgi:AraC-like DNA-binding protein
VALHASFSDQSQFSLYFKRLVKRLVKGLVGVTPGQFNRQ